MKWSTGSVPRSNDCSISTWRTAGWASLGAALRSSTIASRPVGATPWESATRAGFAHDAE